LTNQIGNKKAAVAFKAILDRVDRDDVADILLNWNDSELSEDGSKIIQYVGRDREYSHGATGGKSTVSKKEFLAWLLSEAPFDEGVYGKGIRMEADWVKKINSARVASGLQSGDSIPLESCPLDSRNS
jgi:hypothetical protein